MPTYHQITETSPLLHDANCVYCHVDLELGDYVTMCEQCAAPHHVDCWQSNGNRCAVFECNGTGQIWTLSHSANPLTGRPIVRRPSNPLMHAAQSGRPKPNSASVAKSDATANSCFTEMVTLAISIFFILVLCALLFVAFVLLWLFSVVIAEDLLIPNIHALSESTLVIMGLVIGAFWIFVLVSIFFVSLPYALSLAGWLTRLPSRGLARMQGGETEPSLPSFEFERKPDEPHTKHRSPSLPSEPQHASRRLMRRWFGAVAATGFLVLIIIFFLTQPKVAVLRGHTQSVESVSWSPDGSHLASGAFDGTVRIWDMASGEVVSVIKANSWVESVSWSPDGSQVASGAHDDMVRIWDVASGGQVSALRGHTEAVYSVSWSPDGSQLASSSWDTTMRIWDVESGKRVRVLRGHTERVNSVQWSPDGTHLASGSDDKTVRIWAVATGEVVSVLEAHARSVMSVNWSPDGSRVASAPYVGEVRIWDVASGEQVSMVENRRGGARSVSWSPDGSQVATGSWNDTVRIWDVESGEHVSRLRGFADGFLSVSWSPDGSQIAGGYDSTVLIWDLE